MRWFAAAAVAACVAAGCSVNSARPDAEEIERGRVLYAANGCGTCHGLTGQGDGPVARTLDPPPRDFRDAAAFKNGTAPSSVASTIATGLTRDGGQMQSYGHLSERERYLLARYVLSLRESVSTGQPQPLLRVSGAWVREPVPGRPSTAAYAVVENPASFPVEIEGAAADVAGVVEMHETIRSGDMMKMSPVARVVIPASGRTEFRPNGLHLMLFDLKRPLKAGETVILTFTTGAGQSIQAAAPVKREPW
jgi:copper(I)-binding protein